MLERWLAHHLAELMVAAERATGPEKAEAEARAADLILRLWARRRDLPAAADPLGGYREAIAVLSRVLPDRNPWAAWVRHSGPEQLFHDLFDCMARVVVCGLLLTMARPPREVAPAEEAAMEQEELVLREHLEWWEKAISPALPSDVRPFAGPDDLASPVPVSGAVEGTQTPAAGDLGPTGKMHTVQSGGVSGYEDADEEREFDSTETGGDDPDDASSDLGKLRLRAHEAVTAELERLQQEVATLVERWHSISG